MVKHYLESLNFLILPTKPMSLPHKQMWPPQPTLQTKLMWPPQQTWQTRQMSQLHQTLQIKQMSRHALMALYTTKQLRNVLQSPLLPGLTMLPTQLMRTITQLELSPTWHNTMCHVLQKVHTSTMELVYIWLALPAILIWFLIFGNATIVQMVQLTAVPNMTVFQAAMPLTHHYWTIPSEQFLIWPNMISHALPAHQFSTTELVLIILVLLLLHFSILPPWHAQLAPLVLSTIKPPQPALQSLMPQTLLVFPTLLVLHQMLPTQPIAQKQLHSSMEQAVKTVQILPHTLTQQPKLVWHVQMVHIWILLLMLVRKWNQMPPIPLLWIQPSDKLLIILTTFLVQLLPPTSSMALVSPVLLLHHISIFQLSNVSTVLLITHTTSILTHVPSSCHTRTTFRLTTGWPLTQQRISQILHNPSQTKPIKLVHLIHHFMMEPSVSIVQLVNTSTLIPANVSVAQLEPPSTKTSKNVR